MAMYKIKQLQEIIKNTKIRHRDYQLESVLGNNEVGTKNQQFINEVRDHLSTCINRSEFVNNYYFLNPDLFIVEKLCDCKVHIENAEDFDKNIQILYLSYKDSDDFTPETILNNVFLEKLKTMNEKKID